MNQTSAKAGTSSRRVDHHMRLSSGIPNDVNGRAQPRWEWWKSARESIAAPAAASVTSDADQERLRLGAFRLSPTVAFAGFTLLHMAVWTVLPAVFDRAGQV